MAATTSFDLFLNGPIPASFLFIFVLSTISIQIENSVDGVLGIRTRGHRMVGADKTTEYDLFGSFRLFIFER